MPHSNHIKAGHIDGRPEQGQLLVAPAKEARWHERDKVVRHQQIRYE